MQGMAQMLYIVQTRNHPFLTLLVTHKIIRMKRTGWRNFRQPVFYHFKLL